MYIIIDNDYQIILNFKRLVRELIAYFPTYPDGKK